MHGASRAIKGAFHSWLLCSYMTAKALYGDAGARSKHMTSEDRREARYRRRREMREEKRQASLAQHGTYDKVFSFGNLYRAYKGARKNVGWKPSTKRFVACAPGNVWKLYDELERGVYKSEGFTEFDIHERGKQRHIRAVKISERIVQKCSTETV